MKNSLPHKPWCSSLFKGQGDEYFDHDPNDTKMLLVVFCTWRIKIIKNYRLYEKFLINIKIPVNYDISWLLESYHSRWRTLSKCASHCKQVVSHWWMTIENKKWKYKKSTEPFQPCMSQTFKPWSDARHLNLRMSMPMPFLNLETHCIILHSDFLPLSLETEFSFNIKFLITQHVQI